MRNRSGACGIRCFRPASRMRTVAFISVRAASRNKKSPTRLTRSPPRTRALGALLESVFVIVDDSRREHWYLYQRYGYTPFTSFVLGQGDLSTFYTWSRELRLRMDRSHHPRGLLLASRRLQPQTAKRVLRRTGRNFSGIRMQGPSGPAQAPALRPSRFPRVGLNPKRRRMNIFELIKESIGRATNGGRVGRLRSKFVTLISVYSVSSVVLTTQSLRLSIIRKSSLSVRSVASGVGSSWDI